ncbi:GNAT family N-acetyltransferase [Radiobacillus sp. PE A8.2]|uniref:GNAT family N-acetyltransferase n=1 Tax=Radiobacillus sp. PE A8.2 TaxID=3380349 RepID=UPI00388D9033
MEWQLKTFEQLSTSELYSILKARVDVFVVEQNCPYPEVDNVDQACLHLFSEKNGEIIAYARLIPSEILYPQASIGRVLIHKAHRGHGYAHQLMKKAIEVINDDRKQSAIKLHGQEYLRHFYGSFGFKEITEVYLEDNIPHVDMLLELAR